MVIVNISGISRHRKPQYIPGLSNVIEAQSSLSCCFVLCSTDNINKDTLCIIYNWTRLHSIPNDIINILFLFCKQTTIYSTTKTAESGHESDEILIHSDIIACMN